MYKRLDTALIALILLAGGQAFADDQSAMTMPTMSMPMAMTGALGPYAMTRESSGTSWQPDDTPRDGLHEMLPGDWMVMSEARLNGVYDWQSGPRGGDKTFASGMAMAMAEHELTNGDRWELRAMVSPDALMGRNGYPLLLQAGETANGATPLVDRAHPHDLFMELATSYSHPVGDASSVFIYAGWPGEPALGPPAFMHRLSGLDSPETPISHHWLDSTHIVEGVATAGWIYGNWKVEVSQFTGREPNQNRFDIEHATMDSTSGRLSWNPTAQLALQVSWGDLHSPEQLEPLVNEKRWTASAIYTVPVGDGLISTTLAWGRKDLSNGLTLDAGLFEAAWKPTGAWSIFMRAEVVDTNELSINLSAPFAVDDGAAGTVGKLSVGIVHDWRIASHLKFGIGGLYDFDWVPGFLRPSYGGNPRGAMGFIRLKVD